MRAFFIVWSPVALMLLACGEPDLEVKGNLDRVVGETVTLKLESGKDGFSGKLDLIDAKARRYSAADAPEAKTHGVLGSINNSVSLQEWRIQQPAT